MACSPFILLNNLKCVNHRKLKLSLKNTHFDDHFSASWPLLHKAATSLVPSPHYTCGYYVISSRYEHNIMKVGQTTHTLGDTGCLLKVVTDKYFLYIVRKSWKWYKIYLKNRLWRCKLKWSDLGLGPIAVSSEQYLKSST